MKSVVSNDSPDYEVYGEGAFCDTISTNCYDIEDEIPYNFNDFALDVDSSSDTEGYTFSVGHLGNLGHAMFLEPDGDYTGSSKWFVVETPYYKLNGLQTSAIECCENDVAVTIASGEMIRKSDSQSFDDAITATTHDKDDLSSGGFLVLLGVHRLRAWSRVVGLPRR